MGNRTDTFALVCQRMQRLMREQPVALSHTMPRLDDMIARVSARTGAQPAA